ncbi:hypothetical protein [Enterobacter phage 01_vB_Eclo_IJM]|nr:hypothetical protein [Enterobacter phage 01_vB_Eclo_IJM]
MLHLDATVNAYLQGSTILTATQVNQRPVLRVVSGWDLSVPPELPSCG